MASAGARFESARASGDRAAARAAVEDIVSDAKDPAKRAALASSGAAVSIAAELLRARARRAGAMPPTRPRPRTRSWSRSRPWRARCGTCAPVTRSRAEARARSPRRDAPEALALALPALAARVDRSEPGSRVSGSSGSETEKASKAAVSALAAATQLACNLIAGGGVAAETTWRVLFPKHFAVIAALKNEGAARATHPALCSAMSARFAATGLRSADGRLSRQTETDSGSRQTDAYDAYDAYDEREVCGFVAGATVWRPLLRASVRRGDAEDDSRTTRDVGVEDVGETLLRFVESFCLFGGEAAPPLCRALAPLAAETARARDEALRRKILGMALHADGAREGTKTNDEKKNDDEKEKAAVRERFSVEQATLLELVARAAAAAPARDPSRERSRLNARDLSREAACVTNAAPPATLVLSEGTAAYVLDLASRAAEALGARGARRGRVSRDWTRRSDRNRNRAGGGRCVSGGRSTRDLARVPGRPARAQRARGAPRRRADPGGRRHVRLRHGRAPFAARAACGSARARGRGNSEKKKARGPSAAGGPVSENVRADYTNAWRLERRHRLESLERVSRDASARLRLRAVPVGSTLGRLPRRRARAARQRDVRAPGGL